MSKSPLESQLHEMVDCYFPNILLRSQVSSNLEFSSAKTRSLSVTSPGRVISWCADPKKNVVH